MKKSPTIALLALLWLVSIFLAYYVYHKPFDPASAGSLFLTLGRLLLLGVLLFISGGLGRLIFRSEALHPLANLAVQSGLGLGLLGLGVLITGSLVGLPGWFFPVVTLLLLGLLFTSGLGWLRQLGELRPIWQASTSFFRWLSLLVAGLLLCPLLISLAPPFRYDALVSHLVLPRLYLDAGRVSYLPEHMLSGMPQTIELLYSWLMSMGGAAAAAPLGWAVGCLALLGLFGFLYQRLDARGAWVGLASLAASTSLLYLFGWAYVEPMPFLLGLGVFLTLDLWQRSGDRKTLILAGLLAGMSMGSKYTGGVILLSGIAAILVHHRKDWKRSLLAIFTFGAAAMLIFSPWLVKNALTTGNPFYPFFFEAGAMTPVRLQVYQSIETYGNWLDILFLPIRATIEGRAFSHGYDFSAGALLLGLGGLSILARKKLPEAARPTFRLAVALSLSGIVIWVIGNQLGGNLVQTRFYISVFPAFACLAALGDFALTRLELPQVRLGRIVNLLLAMALTFNFIEVGLATLKAGPGKVLTGLQSEADYLANNLGWYQPTMQALKGLPEGSYTFLLYEPRSFYCLPMCESDEILDRWKVTQSQHPDFSTIRQAWIAEGATHLLFYKSGLEFLVESGDPNHSEQDLQSLQEFLQTLPDPVDFGGVYLLYSLVE